MLVVDGATDEKYGIFTIGKAKYKSHRVAFYLYTGQKPNVSLGICHTCDIPNCVNPHHLFEGTRSENLLDMSRKGRYGTRNIQKGEKHPLSKLSDTQIQAIRKEYIPRKITERLLAKRYNVSPTLIRRVLKNETRKIQP